MTHLISRTLQGATLALVLGASAATAATYTIVEEGTPTVLGTFEAPAGGGAVTAGVFSLSGGTFDTLSAPPTNPVYDAVENWIVGGGASFGAFTNSVAFNTMDFLNNAISCGIGECVLSFTNSGGITPPEWYLDYIPGNPGDAAPIDLGFYEIQTSDIPLPAAAWLLIAGLGALAAAGRRRAT